MNKHIRILIFLLLLGTLAVITAEASSLEDRLNGLEGRLGSRGSGQLFQYEKGVSRLDDTLRKDEYLHLGRFVRNQILAPWRDVDAVFLLNLAMSPPSELNSIQRDKLRWNTIKVRQVTTRLRRVRRLVTRASSLNSENQRRARELTRTLQQWEKTLAAFQMQDPHAASVHATWMNQSYLPTLESVRNRDEALRERFDRLSNWSEDGNLRTWLHRVGEVAEAVEKLNRLYH
jgi:hypothetical protein